MSTLPYQWPDDREADRQWQRQEMALQSLSISDVLAEVDDLIASQPDPEKHPLHSLVANALDKRVMAGTPESLQERFGRMIDHCIEKLVEAKQADLSGWEVD